MNVLKRLRVLHQQYLLCIHSYHWHKTFFHMCNNFWNNSSHKVFKTWISSKYFSSEVNCFCLLGGGWWPPSQFLAANKLFSSFLFSVISNVLLIPGFSTCDCLLPLSLSLLAFFNASTLFFEVFLLLETFEAEVNGMVSFKFNFLVLNLSLFCLCCIFNKCIFIVAYSNFLLLASKRPFSRFIACSFSSIILNSLWISISKQSFNFAA